MSTLAQIRDRVELMLQDTGNAIYAAALIDECLQQALDQFNYVSPQGKETVITLPGDGREIALDSITGLTRVTEVWWPYDSDAADETWPPNRVKGFRLWWDDARPVLFLDIVDQSQPQTNEEVRIWYTIPHTIENLASATITSLLAEHESLIVLGAAGHSAMARAVDLTETPGTDLYAIGLIGTWGQRKLREFNAELKKIQEGSVRFGPAWGEGWSLDKWDEGR